MNIFQVEALESLGLAGLFLATLLSSTIIPTLGIPLIILLLAKNISPFSIITVASLGNWLGAVFNYYLGFLCKWDWLQKYFKVSKEKIESLALKTRRNTFLASIFVSLPIIGDRIPVVLGFLRTSKLKCFSFMLIGKFLRYVILISGIKYYMM